jgi:hypothetical protein
MERIQTACLYGIILVFNHGTTNGCKPDFHSPKA